MFSDLHAGAVVFAVFMLAAGITHAEPEKAGDVGAAAPGVEVKEVKEVKMVTEAGNLFALDLYARLKKQEGNVFFSPYSISTALAMTWTGARGKTAGEMSKVLHFGPDTGDIQAGYRLLIESQNEAGSKGIYQLSVANALWGQKGCGFLKEYLELVEKTYQAGLQEMDFATAAKQARLTINAWVEEKTNGKIKDLLPPGSINSMTRLVLTNAIYFKGAWIIPFKENMTKPEPFTLIGGKKIDAPLMHLTEKFRYAENDDMQALELPYTGGELSMVILLPKKIDGIRALENKLDTANLNSWLGEMNKQKVIVAIPKFKMTQTADLGKELKAMGMKLAFSGKADFSGMTGRKGLSISAVIHKAFVDVNEEGTEAAAATAVVMRVTAVMPVKPTPVFRADHPFIFMIRDMKTGSILFIGRVMNPAK